MIQGRTVVCIHGVSLGKNSDNVDFAAPPLTDAIQRAAQGQLEIRVPVVECLWADLAYKYAKPAFLRDADAHFWRLIEGGPEPNAMGIIARFFEDVLERSFTALPDLIADVFTYNGPSRVDEIRDHCKRQVLEAYRNSGRGVILHGDSLGSVIAIDILIDMLDKRELLPDADPDTWPVRSLVTTGSPLGHNLPSRVGVAGYTNRSQALDQRLSQAIGDFRWENIYDRSDPIVSGCIFGLKIGIKNLSRFKGYQLLNVRENPIETGEHLLAHLGYLHHSITGGRLLELAQL